MDDISIAQVGLYDSCATTSLADGTIIEQNIYPGGYFWFFFIFMSKLYPY